MNSRSKWYLIGRLYITVPTNIFYLSCACIQFDGSAGRPTTNTLLDVSLLLNNLPKFSPTMNTSGNVTCPGDEKQKLTPDLFSKYVSSIVDK